MSYKARKKKRKKKKKKKNNKKEKIEESQPLELQFGILKKKLNSQIKQMELERNIFIAKEKNYQNVLLEVANERNKMQSKAEQLAVKLKRLFSMKRNSLSTVSWRAKELEREGAHTREEMKKLKSLYCKDKIIFENEKKKFKDSNRKKNETIISLREEVRNMSEIVERVDEYKNEVIFLKQKAVKERERIYDNYEWKMKKEDEKRVNRITKQLKKRTKKRTKRLVENVFELNEKFSIMNEERIKMVEKNNDLKEKNNKINSELKSQRGLIKRLVKKNAEYSLKVKKLKRECREKDLMCSENEKDYIKKLEKENKKYGRKIIEMEKKILELKMDVEEKESLLMYINKNKEKDSVLSSNITTFFKSVIPDIEMKLSKWKNLGKVQPNLRDGSGLSLTKLNSYEREAVLKYVLNRLMISLKLKNKSTK